MTLKKSGAGMGCMGWGLSLDGKPWRARTWGKISAMWWRPEGRVGEWGMISVYMDVQCTNQNGNFRFGDRQHVKLP